MTQGVPANQHTAHTGLSLRASARMVASPSGDDAHHLAEIHARPPGLPALVIWSAGGAKFAASRAASIAQPVIQTLLAGVAAWHGQSQVHLTQAGGNAFFRISYPVALVPLVVQGEVCAEAVYTIPTETFIFHC